LKKGNKQLKIIPMKKSINRQNTQKSSSKTGDNINFNFDNKNEDYKSPSNNNQKIKFNNELKIESKDIINKSKILKRISKEKKNLKDNSNSSYIFYQNTYNTMDSFTSNNKANTELVNSKVHKAQGDEPKDNCSKNRRIKSKMIKRKINSNSNSNTIIINNNMQINTFINNDNNNYKDVNFQPQIINIVLNGKIGFLPPKFGIWDFENITVLRLHNYYLNFSKNISCYKDNDLIKGYQNPSIIHYVLHKPYRSNNYKLTSKFVKIWKYYAQKTDEYKNIIKYYNFKL
jgi:hypothetical protein